MNLKTNEDKKKQSQGLLKDVNDLKNQILQKKQEIE